MRQVFWRLQWHCDKPGIWWLHEQEAMRKGRQSSVKQQMVWNVHILQPDRFWPGFAATLVLSTLSWSRLTWMTESLGYWAESVVAFLSSETLRTMYQGRPGHDVRWDAEVIKVSIKKGNTPKSFLCFCLLRSRETKAMMIRWKRNHWVKTCSGLKEEKETCHKIWWTILCIGVSDIKLPYYAPPIDW